MSVSIIILVLLFHWISDFLLQNDWMAINKSINFGILLVHTFIYSLAMGLLIQLLIEFNMFGAQYWYASLLFSGIMFITHTIIDFITSKINSKLYTNHRHWFFSMIGFDQWLHYITIFLSIKYIFY